MTKTSSTHQATANLMLRVAGKLLPTFGGLDFRVAGRMHPIIPRDCPSTWTAGNGFRLGRETNNAAYLAGVNERRFLRMILQRMKFASFIVNVGANIGYTALWLANAMAKRGEACRFLALEPEPGTFAMLKQNISLNRLPVSALCVAAGDCDSRAMIYSTGSGDGAASFDRMTDGVDASAIEVAVMRLDSLLSQNPHEAVSGLVVDVEGYAGAVLRGGERTLYAYRPFVAVEIHHDRELREIEACLSPLGYELNGRSDSLWGSHRIWFPGPRAAT